MSAAGLGTAVVTGAGGFVGSNLVDRLLADGFLVRGIDSFNNYYDRKIKERNLLSAQQSSRFELITTDLKSEVDLGAIFRDAEYVFHQAGQPGVRSSWGTEFVDYVGDNVLGTQRLLEACIGVSSIRKIVYASSSSIYGSAESTQTAEDKCPLPISPYGITKLAAENLCRAYASQFQLPTVSLRYFTVFGPRQRPDMAIQRLLLCAKDGNNFTLWGDGSYERDFTYIDDVVEANILAATCDTEPGAVFNVGGGEPIRLDNLIALVEQITGSKLVIRRTDRQPGDPSSTSADSTKIRKELKWQRATSLESGLRAQFEAIKKA